MGRSPNHLLYAKSHEWADVSNDGGKQIATIGISAFAIEQLTDLVYMGLPSVGSKVTAGEEFGEVESVKAVSTLYSPVDGEVIEVHDDLPDNLDRLKSDPYDYGWICKVRLSSAAALSGLLNHSDYEKQCNEAG